MTRGGEHLLSLLHVHTLKKITVRPSAFINISYVSFNPIIPLVIHFLICLLSHSSSQVQ